MRYVSTFSGVEAATLAWRPLGWQALCFAEVDPFPSAVLRERFPEVPNFGDVTKVDWRSLRGTADLVVGGSPCQSFSVAGSRTGLDGASGLMWEYVRCVRDVMPRWLLWENVPGALSSSHGEDFRCLPGKLMPLVEAGMTEADCLELCYARGHTWEQDGVRLYDVLDRVSCWCCRNKNLKELEAMREHLPRYYEMLVAIERTLGEPMKRRPLEGGTDA